MDYAGPFDTLWEQSLLNKAEIPTWQQLNAFLTERHRTLEAIDDVRPSGSSQSLPKTSALRIPPRDPDQDQILQLPPLPGPQTPKLLRDGI